MVAQDDVIAKLKECFDPEIPIDIWELGLIYGVAIEDDVVKIRMTLTSQHCPAAQSLPSDVKKRVSAIPGVKDAQVEVVWEPAWGPDRITPAGKKTLGIDEENY